MLFSFRLAPSVDPVGAVWTVLIWDNASRSGSPIRSINSEDNPSQFQLESEENKVHVTITAAQIDGSPTLQIGDTYYAAINGVLSGDTDATRLGEFELEVRG